MKINVKQHDAVTIRTSHVFPPIPIRSADWSAVIDGDEESGPYGWGSTEQEAIDDLIDQLEDAEGA